MPDLSNPVKKDEWARSQGYDGWNQYLDSGGSEASASGDYNASYDEILRGLEGDINKYIDELQNIAQGNYDFAAKWIEANYKEALGTDDSKRAEFFKSVANDLEKQIGRIAFDQQTGSYRLTQTRDLALQRLKEDEQVLTRDLTTKRMLEREQQRTNLNARGLMDSGSRENVQGIAQRDIGRLEQDYTNQFEALGRAIGREGEDINRTYTLGQEDLTTNSRRLAENAQQTKDYSLEQQILSLENEKKRLEAEKSGLLREAKPLAIAQVNRTYGVA